MFIPAPISLHFFGKHSSHAAITREDYSLTLPPPSTARYSFIHLSEQGRGIVERMEMPKLQNGSKWVNI